MNIDSSLDQIPDDFSLLLKALGHETRLKILLLLVNHDSPSLSKLARSLKESNSLVLNHLNKLEVAGVVQNFIQKKEGIREFSFYEVTEYGEKIISDLITGYNDFFKGLQKKSFIQTTTTQIPDDLKVALKALSSKFRFALTDLMIDSGALTFTELLTRTNKKKSTLTHHLKKLELGGLVQNFLQKSEHTSEYSHYEATDYGKMMIQSLRGSYNEYYTPLRDQSDETESEMPKKVSGKSQWLS